MTTGCSPRLQTQHVQLSPQMLILQLDQAHAGCKVEQQSDFGVLHRLPGKQRYHQAEGELTCMTSLNIFSPKIKSISCRVAAGSCTGREGDVGS